MGWRGMLRDLQYRPLARVVKLVDTGDLKSPDHCDRAGSSPAPGTTEFAISLCGEAARVVMDRGSEGQ